MRWLRLGALPLLLLLAVFGSSSDLGVAAREAAPAASGDAEPAPATRPKAVGGTVSRGSVPGPDLPVTGAAGLGPEALGRGAVRRTFTAPADGWYRLAARGPGGGWVVTVVDPDGDGVLASSRWEDDPDGGALVHARAGADLAVLVGAVDGPGGAFELEWRGTAAPTRLRHVGRLVDGGPDARGVPVEIRGAGDLAFGAGRLYLASALGLSEFERDAASGGLAFVRLLEADLAGARLAWDAGRARLLAHDCGAWTAFERRADGGVGPPRELAAVGDPARCGRLLVDAAGALVHRVGASEVDTFAVTRDGGLRFAGATPVPGLKGAALGAAGHVYVAAGDALWVIRARAAAARFAAAPTGARLATAAPARVPLAVDAAGERLLAVDAAGARLFALGPAAPDGPPAATELPVADGPAPAGCSFAAMRPDATVDLICAGGVVTARWFEGSRAFGGARRVGGVPDFGTPLGAAATPDGRYVYVSTPAHGILTFERSTADDHGDDPATATVVAIPSTTAGELGLGDKDYFRIDIIRAGILTFETTGGTDTYGTLYDGDGTVLEEDDDRGPRPTNFGISDVLLFEGTYFVEVREVRGVTGAYELRVTGDARSPATPAATAPSVSINAIPSGNEETTVRLGATLTGGAYDGAVDHAWSVDGGTLDSSSSATPVWTRPAVTSNTNHTVRLTVTVRGTGTNAESGTSDSASANRQALVRDVPPPPPAADAPSVTINAIPDGNENTTARLGATLTGGTYDGSVEFAWTVTGGRLANPNSATPTWTRPTVSADADHTVRLTVTVRGRGTNARGGTSERADANRTARVLDVPAQLPVAAAPSVSINAIPAGNEGTAVQLGATLNGGTHDGALDYAWTVTGGTLDNANVATPTWTRPSVASNANFTVRLTITARGAGTIARNGTSDTASTSRSAQVRNVVAPLPVAAAPSVSIDAIAAGDEGTTVTLGATLNGGTHDGAVEYAWTVTGGTLNDPAAATPTWTRPSVTSNTNFTVRLTVTARGAGTVARSGTSDTANATFSAQVRNVVVVLPVAAAPSVTINAIPVGDENTNVQLAATLNGGTYDGAVEYAWSVNGGALDSSSSATPTWARPSVTSNTNHTVSLTITVRGSGTVARNGTSDTDSTTRSAQVRDSNGDHGNDRASATTVAIPSTTAGTLTRGDRDYFRIEISQAGSLLLETTSGIDTYGTLFGSDGSQITRNDDGGDNFNFRISRFSIGAGVYYLEVRGFQPSTTGAYSLEVSGTARSAATQLPAALAPSVSIDAIPAGDEGTDVQLAATLTDGTYDGTPDYTWSVSGGTLDNANLAAPTWTRPAVSADANHTVSLAVSVDGSGTNAGSGTSDTASTSRTAQVRDVPLQLPPAAAPSVSINTIPAGNEGTDVQLSAALGSGTHDGAVEYQWSVDGGVLDNANAASPTWTRPSVTSNTNHTVSLTITVRGTGTTARSGTSDTANTSRSAQVRNVVVLPAAAAPKVTINAVPAGNENTTVQLGATLSGGGSYDGAVEYDWSVNGGTLDNANSATPNWTRPSVTSDSSRTVSLTVTVRGTGTAARNGTSDTASTSLTAQVRDAGDHGNDRASATRVGIPSTTAGTITAGDRDYFRIDVGQAGSLRLQTSGTTDTWGTLFDSGGSKIREDDDAGPGRNFRIFQGSLDVGTYYVEVRGWGRRTAGDYTLEVTGTARSTATQLPAASAPSVSINSVPAGDEGTAVQLGATLAGGTYDGAVNHTWSVSGGTLDNANLAAPTWTRPTVNADANHTVSLTVTVGGTGANASNGSSDTANASRTAQVRDVPRLPPAAAPSVSINAIPAGDEGTDVRLGATLTGGTYDGPVEYDWGVTGGTLDDETAATPNWTRPTVASDGNHAVTLTVTVRGAGAAVRNGTSDSANTNRAARVRNVVVLLPDAAAPTVTINAVPAGNENTTVQLGATLSGGGTYDGAVEYNWSVNGGVLNDSTLATPNWTRPSVTSDSSRTVSLTVTVRGTGTAARSGTSDTASTSLTAQVRDAGDHGNDQASATRVAIPSTTAGTLTSRDRDYFRIEVGQAGSLRLETTSGLDTYGTLLRGDGSQVTRNDDSGSNNNFRISMGSIGAGVYYLQVRGFHHTTTGPYSLEVSGTARGPGGLPAASAPAVAIDSIPAGDEGTAVQLAAALTGGTYDGAVGYAWSVDGGTLDDSTLATPTWTRPAVTSDTNHTASLIVTVQGSGTNAASGSSATANASRTTLVRNVTTALPVAAAPAVTINNIPAGDEGSTFQLGATLSGGTYDGAVDYTWSVSGGTLDNANLAAPTWTRPAVNADASHTVSLTVSVDGTGTNASSGTSDTASTSRDALVRNDTGVLPAASAPAVSINAIADGDEATSVQLSAAMNGGDYDGTPEYAWSVTRGTLANPNSATPTWTRPKVASDTNHTVRLTVTVRGDGTAALDGTSDSQSASRSTQVRDTGGTGDDHGNNRADASPVSIPSTTVANLGRSDRDYYRIDVAHTGSLRLQTRGFVDTVGTLQRSNGAAIASNDDGGERQNFHIFRSSVGVGVYYLEVRGYSNSSTSRGDYKLEVTGTARGADSLPSAAAPSVTINTIADGDEGATVQLGANVTGGTYDGAVDYAWSVDGGTLDDSTLATPTWTRPAVTSDTNHTASLIVTVQGSGTNAASGTSATANASRTTLVRNVTTALPVAAAPAVTINAIPAGDEGSTVQLGAALSGGTYDGAVEYAWTATGGTLANADTATPTWTRPAVNANTNYTLRLTVTARGAGTNARNGTSATANASRTAQVRNLAQLPVAAAPTVTIDAIPAGDEGYTVQLGANVTGGTYDGPVEYDWSVNGGALNDATLATPTWTRPTVSANTNYTANLTVTVNGTGTAARDGTSDTASVSASATVRDIPRLTVTTLASNLTIPWDLDFTPDGTMLFTERAGKLSARLTDGTVQTVTAALGDVYAVGESGLMAIVVDPHFISNRRFYTCQAHTGPEVQVIAWTIDSGYTTATRVADPLVGGIPAKAGSGRHSGCRLRFGPVGQLWIATGDAAIGSTPQDMNSLGGKVLRVNSSIGAGVVGNPFPAAPRIYSFGHRNIQGLALRPGTRQMWVVEHGPTTDDEINLLASGGNYGWDPTQPGSTYYEDVPMTDLNKFPGAVPAKWSSGRPTLATSGGVFLEGAGWRGWEGRLAVASLKDRSLRLFEFSSSGDLVSEVYVSSLSNSYGRLRTPMLGPDGALYLTTSNGSAADRILRIEAGDGTSVQRADAAAPSVSIDAVADGDEGTTVQLGATLTSGIYDGAVEYDWRVSGGAVTLDDHTAAAPTWTRPAVGTDTTYAVHLTVTVNGTGTNAVNGTSDIASASTRALVHDDAIPAAAAPSVSINTIADGNEGTSAQLSAAVTGGTYDGAVEYDWSVSGGTLNNDSIASPTWTRPTVRANANYTASLTVTVRGSGTNARHGSIATASATRSALVRNDPLALPVAVAPTVTINAVAAGDEGTNVQLSATVTGGTYDTGVDYVWRVASGLLNDASSATPTWTRPSVAFPNWHVMVHLTASVGGSGTRARDGSSATTIVTRMATVRNTGPDDHGDDTASATTVQLPSTTSAQLDPGDRDYFRINIVRAGTLRLGTTGSVDTYGTLYNSSGVKLAENDDEGGGDGNFRINTTSLPAGAYYLDVRGYNGASHGNYSLSVAGTASGTAGPPVADPPFVTINFIPAGDGGTAVQLDATLTSGAYDGTPEYAWTVDGGTLDNASSATPTLTRPTVSADTTYNAGLTVTVKGTGTNARSGTSASVTANRNYTVRSGSGPGGGDDHGDSSAAATAITLSGTTAGELETSGDEDWFWFTLNSQTRVVAQTTGSTDTTGYLYDSDGNPIARDDDRGAGRNFLIARELGAGTYFIRVRGWQNQETNRYATGTYTLSVGPPPANLVPKVTTSRLPTAQTATAGGAARLYRVENAFSDDDGEYLWLAPSSDNETVATVALEGPSLAVYPHTAGNATITMTARDPKGGSVSGSFTLTVSTPTTADPTSTFNAAGDLLTLSFSDQFASNETRAYQVWVRQKSPRGGWNKLCFPATNQSSSTVTENISLELPMDGITEPGAVFETQYRHVGSSCNGTPLDKLWSRVAEATAPGTPSFNIDIVWLGSPTAAHRAVMEHAAQQWERIFTMGLPDIDFSGYPGTWTCGGGDLNDVVDDLRLFVRVRSVDGPGGTLATANACTYRRTSGLPIAGYVNIDADDFPRLGTEGSRRVAAHEIGHALGFLSYQFRRLSLLRRPSLPPHSGIVFDAPDTHFTGAGAIAAFEMAGGASYTDAKVPIENVMGSGSGDSHWRESVLDDELMTPRHDGGGDALSAITIQAMADMGYHVDLSQAESYVLPSAIRSFAPGIGSGDAQSTGDGHAGGHPDEDSGPPQCIVVDDAVAIDDGREVTVDWRPGAIRMRPVAAQ